MAIWKRLKTVTVTATDTVSATFDEVDPLDSTHTLVAIVEFDGTMATISGSSWPLVPLDGSGNNGAALCLVAFAIQGDATTNSFVLTLTAARPYAKVILMAFEGHDILPAQGSPTFNSSVTTATAGIISPIADTNTIAIAAVGLIGQSNGWVTGWSDGFTTVPGDTNADRISVGVQAFVASGATPSSTRTWATARNARSMMWLIRGTSSDAGAPVTTMSVVTSPSSSVSVDAVHVTDAAGVPSVVDKMYVTDESGTPTEVYDA